MTPISRICQEQMMTRISFQPLMPEIRDRWQCIVIFQRSKCTYVFLRMYWVKKTMKVSFIVFFTNCHSCSACQLINTAWAAVWNWESARSLLNRTENAQNLPGFLLRTYLEVDSAKVCYWVSSWTLFLYLLLLLKIDRWIGIFLMVIQGTLLDVAIRPKDNLAFSTIECVIC